MDLRQAMEPILGPKAAQVKKSFDIIGDVAIIEIPSGLSRHQKIIAQKLVELNPHLKAVCKKKGGREGPYRLRTLVRILGSSTRTIHKEHGCRFALDVRTVYFSPRESTERQRIAAQVRPRERVLVMFAGVGPFCITIAKKQPRASVVGIESNPAAVKFFEENVRINKVCVTPILSNVTTICKKTAARYDRILMPLPTESYRFLPLAFRCLKKGGVLHFYSVGDRLDPFALPLKRLSAAAKKARRPVRVLRRQEVLPFGPGKTKVCLDVKA